jgi:hypothetical protein
MSGKKTIYWETVGQHACSKKGEKDSVLKNAPFLSKVQEGTNPFLGSGYYYWEENLDMAHYWGKTHYKGNYFIIENTLALEGDKFLDLVGNRKHMKFVKDLTTRLASKGRPAWNIGTVLEFARRMNEARNNAIKFPFKAVRAIDEWVDDKKREKYYFVEGKKNFTYLNPRLVICVYEKENVVLTPTRIIFE